MKWIGRSSLWSGLRLPFRPNESGKEGEASNSPRGMQGHTFRKISQDLSCQQLQFCNDAPQ
jgi:hypothetical protein